MKWAAAKTWLSFVTATRNSLPPDTPPSFEQHCVDRRPREVRGGTGVQCVGVVAQLAVQVGDGGATRASPTVVSASVAASRARSDAPAAPARSAARANGASSNTRPRFVFDGVQRAVASTAARIVVPSGRSPARASAGPIAAALARKSSKVASRNDADGDTLPGLGALA